MILDAGEDDEWFVLVNGSELAALMRELKAREFDIIDHMMTRLKPGLNIVMNEDGTFPAKMDDIVKSLRIPKRLAQRYIDTLIREKIIDCRMTAWEGQGIVEVNFLCPAIATMSDYHITVCEMFGDYRVRTMGGRTFKEVGYLEGMQRKEES